MKAKFYLEGNNEGANFLKSFEGCEVEIQSLYKNIKQKSPPLATLNFKEKKFQLQLIDTKFIDDFIFIYSFVTNEMGDGGKALFRLEVYKKNNNKK